MNTQNIENLEETFTHVYAVNDEAAETGSSQENEPNQKKRITWIDICKGIGIILVILGNIDTIPPALRACIFSFHLPLFMILNGYLIHDYNVKETFVRSLKSLLKPYVVICLLGAVLAAFCTTDIVTAGNTLFSSLNDMIVGLSLTSTMYTNYNSVGLVWFVCCLFLSRNLYVIIRSACAKIPRIIQTLIILFVAFTGCFFGKELAFLPWSLDIAIASVVFIAVGDFLRTYSFKKIPGYILLIIAFISWILLVYSGAWIELAARSYKLGVLCFLCAIAGSIVIIAVSKGISIIPFISRREGGVLAWAGKNSIVILGVHCLETRFFDWNNWVYGPLGITPDWILEFLCRLSFILLVTLGFTLLRKFIRIANDKLREKNASSVQTNRLDWPDVAKGICIISVILGHQGISWINQIVYVYHLPVFFIIAGYFLKKTDGLQFAKAKARRLLLPYAAAGSLICLVSLAKSWYHGSSLSGTLFTLIDATLYGAGDHWETPFWINSIGAVWFLLALFLALVIVNYTVEKKYYQIILASVAFVGWSSFNVTGIWLPLSVQAGMLACVYLLIGYECRKHQLTATRINNLPLFGFILVTAFGIQYFKGIWLVHDYFGNGLFDFFVTIAASLVVFALSEYICHTSEWLKRVLSFLGKNSLVILCAHVVDGALNLKAKTINISNMLNINDNHANLLAMLVCVAYTMVVAAVFVFVRNMIREKRKSL